MTPEARILYEVTAKISEDVLADYLAWLKPHLEKMLDFDGFLSADTFVNAEDECEITSVYRVSDKKAIETYLAGPAAEVRAEAIKRFGDKLVITRRILNAL